MSDIWLVSFFSLSLFVSLSIKVFVMQIMQLKFIILSFQFPSNQNIRGNKLDNCYGRNWFWFHWCHKVLSISLSLSFFLTHSRYRYSSLHPYFSRKHNKAFYWTRFLQIKCDSSCTMKGKLLWKSIEKEPPTCSSVSFVWNRIAFHF